MKYISKYNTYSDINSICKYYGIKNYTINNDGSIDVDGDVHLEKRSLQKIPLNFNRVTGKFDCTNNRLASLKGCPKEVGGDFYCSNNQITSLEGCPEIVGMSFYCHDNKLTSLKGCPKEVTSSFDFSSNRLTSLEGCPKEVIGNFFCFNNQLTSLEGCPKTLGNHFDCSHNKLTSLKGCPKEVGGGFNCYSNKLPNLIMDNLKYIKGIIKWQDEYSIWRKDGSLGVFRFNDMMIDIKNDYDLK